MQPSNTVESGTSSYESLAKQTRAQESGLSWYETPGETLVSDYQYLQNPRSTTAFESPPGATGAGAATETAAAEGANLRPESALGSNIQEQWANAMDVLYHHFDSVSKNRTYVTPENLLEASQNPDLSPELREACALLHGSNALDSKGGYGSREWIGDALAHAIAALPTPSEDPQYRNAVGQLGKYCDLLCNAGDKNHVRSGFGREELKAALDNPGLPPELHEACRYLLDNPIAYNKLATEVGRNHPGINHFKIRDAAEATPPLKPQESSFDKQWAKTLDQLDNNYEFLASLGGSRAGGITREKLEIALTYPNLPPELEESCRFLVDNPAAFGQIASSFRFLSVQNVGIGELAIREARNAYTS